MAYAGQFERGIDGAKVDQTQRHALLAGQHADRRAAGDEVAEHLRGHRLRVGGHAFGDHAVVAGEQRQVRLVDGRLFAPLQGGQAHGQRLQRAEGAARFGQLRLARQGSGLGGCIRLAAGLPPPG